MALIKGAWRIALVISGGLVSRHVRLVLFGERSALKRWGKLNNYSSEELFPAMEMLQLGSFADLLPLV